MSNYPIITITDLNVYYGEEQALQNVNLSFYNDDFVGIIGPNGGGKTTLVKSIIGLTKYDGEIKFDRSLSGKGAIGYLPQQNYFDKAFPISVSELVLSGLQAEKRIFGRYTKADKSKADDLMKQIGIYDLRSKAVGELSGGQLQRALLGRAIISEPKVLILDEPANFVDNRFEKELYALLAELNKRMAVIMVSHDVGTITSVVKNIVCVNRTVHRHRSAELTPELLENYRCPIQVISHGQVPHTVLPHHNDE